MCQACNNPDHKTDSFIDIDSELDALRQNLENLIDLQESIDDLSQKDQRFAGDLIDGYKTRGMLSVKQWYWVDQLRNRVKKSEPIYGSFAPILIMFRIAGESIKYPKVRLLSSEDRFVQLNFKPDSKTIDVYIDGWQGHGYRKFAGWIHEDKIVPYRDDRMTDDVKNVIQDLALDPVGTAKAMANKLGACLYCGKRLSDEESKSRGYGRTCAKNWGLPWGKNR